MWKFISKRKNGYAIQKVIDQEDVNFWIVMRCEERVKYTVIIS